MTCKKMNHLSVLTFIRSIIILVCLSLPVLLKAQTDEAEIIYPTTTITPFELPADEPNNFPLYQATPVGDINGDGFTDLLYKSGAADERTPNMADWILKSVIITEPGINPEGIVFYDADFYGIGDYNGDGFDDVLDFKNKLIRFGCAEGIANDSLVLSYPDDISEFIMAGDINNDGYSEFILSGSNPMVIKIGFSGPEATTFSFPIFEDVSHIYDFDNDGETEICFAWDDRWEEEMCFYWYELDTINMALVLDHAEAHDFIHEPPSGYPYTFCDINGDDLIDLAYTYWEYDTTNPNRTLTIYNMEVYFGLPGEPYFDDPVEIMLNNDSRMLYDGGDINGDGCDDWYAAYSEDTLIVYYGNTDVTTNGFQKELIYMGEQQQLLLKSGYFANQCLTTKMQDFDYNQDGISDLYLNYLSYDDHQRFEAVGTAIVLGNTSPDFGNPLLIIKTGNHMFMDLKYGKRSRNIGDLNKDGYNDWGTLAQAGCYLDIYLGGQEFDFEPDITFKLPQNMRKECWDWSSGDLNGDGWIDLAISNSSNFESSYYNEPLEFQSDIYIFFGKENMESVYYGESADVVIHDDDSFWEYGHQISIIGDYNADGFDDIVVGGSSAYYYHNTKLVIYYGSNTQIGPDPDLVISNLPDHLNIGEPLTACGDINGDSYADFTYGYGLDPGDGGVSLIYFGGPDADDGYDMVIPNPVPNSGAFGSVTPRDAGDFDGDGYNDLVHYSFGSQEILIYKGGPALDTIHDYAIFDSTIVTSYLYINYIDNLESGKSDISVSSNNFICNDFYIYSNASLPGNEDFVLKNCLGRTGYGLASGDFNGDGITEIFAGVWDEPNFGIRGGIVYFYEPTLFTDIEEEPGALSTDETVRLYPNPTSGVLYLESTEAISQIDIYNHLGQLVYSEKASSFSLAIDLSSAEPGIYFTRITTATGISTQQVIIR